MLPLDVSQIFFLSALYIFSKDILLGRAQSVLSKHVKLAFAHDENRRATYSISNRLMVGSESIFNTFGAQVKQLVAVCNIETTLSLSLTNSCLLPHMLSIFMSR